MTKSINRCLRFFFKLLFIELLINNIRLVRAQIVDVTCGDWVLDYILDVVTIQIIVTDVVYVAK